MKQRKIFTSFAPVHLSFCFAFVCFQRTLLGLGFAIIQINIGTGNAQPGWKLIVVDATQTSSVCQAVPEQSQFENTSCNRWMTNRREVR